MQRLTPEVEANALRTIAEALNRAAGLQEALDRALEAVMPLIGSEAGWIGLLEPFGDVPPVAARNLPPALEADNRAAMQGTCQCLDLLRQGHLQAAANIVECERLRTARGDTRGLRHHASVPLRASGRGLGNLNLTTPADRVFTEAELNLLTAVGDQIGVAIERARLYEQVKAQHIEEQAALLSLSRGFIELLDTNTILDQTAGTVQEIFRADLVSLMFPDADGENLVLRAGRGWERDLYDVYAVDVAMSREGYAFRNGEAVWLEDVQTSTRFPCPRGLRERGIHSSLTAPLNRDHETLGTLCVHFREQRKFDDHDVRLLSLIANTTAQALERARQHAHAVERLGRISALHDIDVAISASLSLQERLGILLEKVAERLGVDAAAIALIDLRTRELVYVARRGLNSDFFQDGLLRVKEGIAGQVAQTGAPMAIPDVRAEPRFVRRAVAERLGIVSYMAVPLRVRGEIIGVLELAARERRAFPQEEIDFFVTLAGQAAIALENARLFEALAAEKQRLELLYHLSRSLAASLEPREVAVRALDLTTVALGVFKGEMFVLEPDSDRLHLIAISGYDATSVEALDRELNLRVGQGLAGRAALARDPHIVPDVAHDEHWLSVPGVDDWVRSAAAIPLLAGDELVGVLNLLSDREAFFHAEDLPLLTAVTVPMALALQNARLFEETGRRVQELALLYDAGLTLNRVIEPRAQLEFLLMLAATALRADAAEFFVFDPARDELRYEFGIGLSAEEAEGLRRLRFAADDENTVPGWVATNRLLLNLPDAPADPRWVVADPAIHSALFVPVAYEKQLRGILGVKSKSGDAFMPQDERLLTLFANQVSVAMNNARLFEETRRRAEELEALSQVSATLRQAQTREAMLPLLVEKSMEALQADAGALILLEEGALVFAAARGPAEALLGSRHPWGDDPLWQVARTGEPIFISDVTERSEFTQWEVCRALMAGMTACACVPLKTAESTVGLLYLACRSRREATRGEIRLLTSIAEMAGNALHRATLHEQTERDAVALALAYDATIEGWARALELRDRETEGHTRRVTEMAERLARAMSMSEGELIHLRRGALLHDMGKMGVPDGILLKPGTLTDEEWMVMRLHPRLAYDMLAPIGYLHPALDIPYCHHEKWDGTGYPRGLKGEQIPLAARIFAVADVWDALRSDRPYRKGWPEEKVREYIREQAGKHFDPQVLAIFLELER